MLFRSLLVLRNGKPAGTMEPGKWFYRKHEEQPTTEVAIRRSVSEDLYVILAGYDVQSQSVTLQVFINPLVSWIWVGFGVLAMGTILALLPERTFAFALNKVPASAATTTSALLLIGVLLLGPAAVASAQEPAPEHKHVPGAGGAYVVPKTPLGAPVGRKMATLRYTPVPAPCGARTIAGPVVNPLPILKLEFGM